MDSGCCDRLVKNNMIGTSVTGCIAHINIVASSTCKRCAVIGRIATCLNVVKFLFVVSMLLSRGKLFPTLPVGALSAFDAALYLQRHNKVFTPAETKYVAR